MEDLIGMRQRYTLIEKKAIKARSKAIKEVMTGLLCWLFGVFMTAILLGAIQLLWVISH